MMPDSDELAEVRRMYDGEMDLVAREVHSHGDGLDGPVNYLVEKTQEYQLSESCPQLQSQNPNFSISPQVRPSRKAARCSLRSSSSSSPRCGQPRGRQSISASTVVCRRRIPTATALNPTLAAA
ncbi:uncharacterized protein A4U43_C09F14150 [Asparagus officinalis]|uniref:Uncharacterized protein n=1 Tax=Asparagus officinalis TaxID=4686 RepID=A0A5P1E9B8_ASPOF|nr:uncharacterized protein A4U43_C09F14150 [Asparagus officinalis]